MRDSAELSGVALAGVAAAELVSAMGTDRWWAAQDNVHAWVRRFRPDLATVTQAELSALRCTALIAHHADGKDMLVELTAAWCERLEKLLGGDPATSGALRQLLDGGLTADTSVEAAAPGGGDPRDAPAGDRSPDEEVPWQDDAVTGATFAYLAYRRLAAADAGADGVDCEAYQLRCLLLMCWGSLHARKLDEAAEATSVALAIHDHVAGRAPGAGPASRLTGGLPGLASWLPEPILRSEGDVLAEAAASVMRHFPEGTGFDPKASVFGEAAVALFRRLAGDDPTWYGSRLATVQQELAVVLRRLGRTGEAVDHVGEACDFWRGPTGFDPGGVALKLDEALRYLHQLRCEQGQPELAAAVSAERVELHRRQVAAEPEWHPGLLASAVFDRGEDLLRLGRHADAVPYLREAAEAYRRLAATHPDGFELILAFAARLLCRALWQVPQRAEAVAASAESVAAFRRLAAADADLGDTFARAVSNHGFYLSSLDRHAEALAATTEAVEAHRNQPTTDPAELAFTLWTFAEVRLAARDELPLAATAIAEAAGIYGELAETAPDRYADKLRQVLTMADDIQAAQHGTVPS
jgi:tetratricopeptide (TPR) repeat protein